MLEQDYIMRMIHEMIRAILKILFNIDSCSQTEEVLESAEQREKLETLKDMVDAGRIDEAENELYNIMEEAGKNDYKIALLFYAYLNEQTDEFLESNNFSRDEVKMGVKDVAECLGVGSMAKMLLDEK